MVKSVTIMAGKTNQIVNINFPDVCGNCRRKVQPEFIAGVFGDYKKLSMEAVFKCNNTHCNSLITGYYQRDNKDEHFKLVYVSPGKPTEKIFSKEIIRLSPKFIRLYNQIVFAEQIGLDLILGIGYRKALELLIKDYLVYSDPQNKQNINDLPLNQCIVNLGNNNIKEISKRIIWLENEGEHYTKPLHGKEIIDLKKLIEATGSFITINLKLKNQLDQMN